MGSRDQLELQFSSPPTGDELKAKGMRLASLASEDLVATARQVARAKCQKWGWTNADYVITAMKRKWEFDVGNWAGSIFSTKEFQPYHRIPMQKSTRTEAHSRRIMNWIWVPRGEV